MILVEILKKKLEEYVAKLPGNFKIIEKMFEELERLFVI